MVEIVFLMLVLKLPIVYLVAVVYWAVRQEPRPPEPAVLPVLADPTRGPGRHRSRRFGPRRGPDRGRGPARRSARVPGR